MNQLTIAGLGDRVGQELGSSDWVTIDQARINTFANCTGDDRHPFPDAESSQT